MAVWCFNVALFMLFLGLMIRRAVFEPSSIRAMLQQPNQSLFLGTMPMSISVITAGIVLLLVPRSVGVWGFCKAARGVRGLRAGGGGERAK